MSEKLEQPKFPVLTVTRYDVVSASLLAIVAASALTLTCLVFVWLANQLPPTTRPGGITQVGFPEGTYNGLLGGPTGTPADFADLESGEPKGDGTDLEEVSGTIESVVSAVGTQQTPQPAGKQVANPGEPNDSVPRPSRGNGLKPLGDGPGARGFPREQRWFVNFSSGGTLDEYARQLDFFTIELAACRPGGEVVYLSNLSQPHPVARTGNANTDERRLYMRWKSGQRRKADVDLFRKAGIDAQDAVIVHFYPDPTEQQLARLEQEYRHRAVDDILRTHFSVRPEGADRYQFVVTNQLYIR